MRTSRYDMESRDRAVASLIADMTNAHYDGGNLKGELTERQWDAAERQAAADERSGELREALICITQAQGAMASARGKLVRPGYDSQWAYDELAASYLRSAEQWIRKAGGKE